MSDTRLGDRRGDWVTEALLPEILAGPVETPGEEAQGPLRSHGVGARGELWATKGPRFPENPLLGASLWKEALPEVTLGSKAMKSSWGRGSLLKFNLESVH